ncbi:arginine/serine-rich protein 1 isoform X1 [Hypanus sabinus]|uniref:arginine/serine-rich protein 1 isoform X1 n=1 Tax=Hypanus sabinus TaxID=79690 RepID=UPI0028C4C54D|nr:arginine/serine-rich protein 1 isoform X1 [Hypanus sabinus]XP_059810523.1 arginine/serine-rich protein 1 isoform X1 [Hypanus sabinus]XP_059810525.1 arginine/serine-rich protein 1 isoform X1 [Hypanus sabinus]XP_059810526.1 arginine/serine-rich protein 1 isoform X1 [Hypanus sabinus]XP_059810527.1 arginine/serine-rich protein 1 isoform X1 [Hypanus sabinus]
MVATNDGGASALVDSSAIKDNNRKRPGSSDLSWELMKKKSNFGKMHLHDNLKRERMSEGKRGTDRCCMQKKKAEKIAIGVDELCLASDKPQKCKRMSRSRTPGHQKCKLSKSGSVSSLGSCCSSSASSRSDSVSSSASSESGSMSSSSCSRSSSVSSSCSSRSSSVSSCSSQSDSMSSSGSSRSSSVSSSGSSCLDSVSPLKRYRSSSKYTNSTSRSRCVSQEKRCKSSRRAHSRSRSRSCSRSCYRRSRYHMPYRSPLRYRSRSSLRHRRSRSGSRSRYSSRRPRNYHSFMYRTHSSQRSRSRSRGRSIYLTQKDKNTLLEIAKANADKLFGKSNIQMPPSLKPTSPFRDENYNFEKSNIDAAKEMIRRVSDNISLY